MRTRLSLFVFGVVALVFVLLFARQVWLSRDLPREKFETKKIRILSYASFVGSFGPGSGLIDDFKKKHGCDVDVVSTSDSGLLIERLKLEQQTRPFDVVIGLDQLELAKAMAEQKWRPLTMPGEGAWNETAVAARPEFFLPYDWSPMGFIYRKGDVEPPKVFEELANARYKSQFALQDPRASSPGLQFYNWVRAIEGDKTKEFLRRFRPNVQSISPSWAFSYGLFKKKQAKFVFSYLTSLAYHWGFEKDRGYDIASFPEGHPVQIEYAGVPGGCHECELGADFVREMLGADQQKLIMERNYMFPVLKGIERETIYAELPALKTLGPSPADKQDLGDWDHVFQH